MVGPQRVVETVEGVRGEGAGGYAPQGEGLQAVLGVVEAGMVGTQPAKDTRMKISHWMSGKSGVN